MVSIKEWFTAYKNFPDPAAFQKSPIASLQISTVIRLITQGRASDLIRTLRVASSYKCYQKRGVRNTLVHISFVVIKRPGTVSDKEHKLNSKVKLNDLLESTNISKKILKAEVFWYFRKNKPDNKKWTSMAGRPQFSIQWISYRNDSKWGKAS